MKLQDLFAPLHAPEHLIPHIEISGVHSDARNVELGGLFVAIPGTKVDGHSFIEQAIANGAAALVVQDRQKVPATYTGFVLTVPSSREALDVLASRFNSDPAENLFCVGVTGTNGKTSVTYMIECLLNSAQKETGVIGTINHHLKDQVWPSEMTTPGPVDLQKRLREFKEAGAKAVAMEVSSHALDQYRVDSVSFDAVVFTNLTRDHLDYHKTMGAYLEAKQRLFTDLMFKTKKASPLAVVNIDDKYGRRLKVADRADIWTYGQLDQQPEADLGYRVLKMGFDRTLFLLRTPHGEIEIEIPMSGVHNVMNATAAVGIALWAGLNLEQCQRALSQFTGVPGRLQSVLNSSDVSVFVDYAHTPDALENVLVALQKVRAGLDGAAQQAKIWTVFGCGGDRDKGKRPLMAQMAVQYSDEIVITSDNPRTEEPQSIIEDIKAGLSADQLKKAHVIEDRREAILNCISKAGPGDVILIAGKGHEDYQIIGSTKHPFSDYQVAQEACQIRRSSR